MVELRAEGVAHLGHIHRSSQATCIAAASRLFAPHFLCLGAYWIQPRILSFVSS